MPTVPRRDQTLLTTGNRPSPREAVGAPSSAFGGLPEHPDISGLTRAVSEIVRREREKADQVAILEADNRLAEIETSLLYDEKAGALTLRGKNAQGAPEAVAAEWEKRVSEVEKGLTTERQQLAFQQRRQSRWASINGTVQRHVASEALAYDNETANAALANRLDAAIRSNGEPHTLETAIAETEVIVGDYGKRNGWSPELFAEKKAIAVSRIHTGVIERLLSQGKDQAASEYFADWQDSIVAAQLPAIEKALEVGSTEGAGLRAADAVWKQHGPKTANDPVKISTMESAIREALPDQP